MKTQVADTSLKAYTELRNEGVIGNQELKILESMDWMMNYSLQELCKITGLQINAVSGRVNGLKEKGLVKVAYKRPCRVTGRVINAVCLVRKERGESNWQAKQVPMFDLGRH